MALIAGGTAWVTSAEGQVVGAGTDIPNDENDGGGGRVNVDLSVPVTLQPGTYRATLFNFDAGVAGDVTPFLAVDNGSNAYTAIAVGSDQTVAAAAQDQSVAFGGSDTFTLNVATTLFAGIASDTQNPIALDNGTASTDHEGGGQDPSTYVVTLGGTVPGDGAFSNPDLGRRYAFSVNVAAVPEPSALALAGVGLTLLARRRRRA